MLYSGKNVSYILASALAWLLDCHSVMLKRRLRVMGKRMEESVLLKSIEDIGLKDRWFRARR
jgi:hypothetical protein